MDCNKKADLHSDSVIMVDEGGSEKESGVYNLTESEKPIEKKKYSRTTDAQFEKLLAYMETHEDFSKGKTSESQAAAWNIVVSELNGMGPPIRTAEEWRIVWSNLKGNRKRKLVQSFKPATKTTLDSNFVECSTYGTASTSCTPRGIHQPDFI